MVSEQNKDNKDKMSDFSALYADSEHLNVRPKDFVIDMSDLSTFRDNNNESPLEMMMDIETDASMSYGKSNVTDDENEDSFASGQLSPGIHVIEETRRALKDAERRNTKLSTEVQELRTLLCKKEMELTTVAQKTTKAMEADFKEERKLFEQERRQFLVEKNDLLLVKESLLEEIQNLTLKLQCEEDEMTPEEEESDKKTLLNEIVRIKTTSAMQEEQFQRRLLAAENNVTKFQNEVIAMEMLKLAMENRIDLLEDEKDIENQKHEEQVTGLLKAAGLYDKTCFETTALGLPQHSTVLTDSWVELFRRQLDDERMKINALKDCLMPYTNCLSREDVDCLHEAGIILIPRNTPPPKANRNSISLFRSFSGAMRPLRK
jgi:hypothetical protein